LVAQRGWVVAVDAHLDALAACGHEDAAHMPACGVRVLYRVMAGRER
jgi:hypothetical protein